MNIKSLVIAGALLSATPCVWAASCNTRSGQVKNQPAPPAKLLSSEELADTPDDVAPAITPHKYDDQSLVLKLEEDITDLRTFGGRYTSGVPILGVRLENYPQFDPSKHCNRVFVQLVKPRIDNLGNGRFRASFEGGRFHFDFDQRTQLDAIEIAHEAEGRFIWMFPALFGKKRNKWKEPWDITATYDDAFKAAPQRSDQRRWIAEAYINLVLRTYRIEMLKKDYPVYHFDRADERALLRQRTGIDCDTDRLEIVCIVDAVIERNEVGRSNGRRFPASAFVSGDALLMNSGISTGIRQLDFSTNNEQANRLGPDLLPKLFRNSAPGWGWRRPIRLWELDWLNKWYEEAGLEANERLSQAEAQKLLLDAHIDFISTAPIVLRRIQQQYEDWPMAMQQLVAAIAIDIENVTGYQLSLPLRAPYHCAVLMDRLVKDGHDRTNESVLKANWARALTAFGVIRERFPTQVLDNCTASDWR